MTCPATITVDGRERPCLLHSGHRFSHHAKVPVPFGDGSGRIFIEARTWNEIGDPR